MIERGTAMSTPGVQLNSTSAEPLYRQLEAVLKNEINSGSRPPGSRLPTENELVQLYHVSRVTVRKALDELSQQGYLERRSGKGTFVAEKRLQRGLSGVIRFSEVCRRMGCEPGGRTVRLSLEIASKKDAEQLQLPENSQIVILERVRSADGEPVVIETSKFPEDFSFLLGEDLNDISLYELLQRKRCIVFTKSTKILDLVYATPQEAFFLNVAKGHPLIRIESVVEDASGHCRTLSKQLCNGDKFKLMV